MIPLKCGIAKIIQMNLYKTEADSKTENKLMVIKGERKGATN